MTNTFESVRSRDAAKNAVYFMDCAWKNRDLGALEEMQAYVKMARAEWRIARAADVTVTVGITTFANLDGLICANCGQANGHPSHPEMCCEW